MKLKRDFVTNSSSCSYIVCIPDIDKAIERISEQMILSEEIVNIFMSSKRHGYINFQSDDEYDEKLHNDFNRIIKILEDLGYPVLFNESGPENLCQMENIAYDQEMIQRIKYVMKDVK